MPPTYKTATYKTATYKTATYKTAKRIFTIGKEEVKRMQVTQSFETQQYGQLILSNLRLNLVPTRFSNRVIQQGNPNRYSRFDIQGLIFRV